LGTEFLLLIINLFTNLLLITNLLAIILLCYY